MSGLSSLKVLMVDPSRGLREPLTQALNAAGVYRIERGTDWTASLTQMAALRPHLVFVDFDAAPDAALGLVRAMRDRRATAWDNRAPVVAVTAKPTVQLVQGLRDGGVNEMLVKPLTTAAVVERLSRVILKPRPFVDCVAYYGPDRRRRIDPNFRGPWRRALENTTDLVY
jgi:PleD family two-component response regulator